MVMKAKTIKETINESIDQSIIQLKKYFGMNSAERTRYLPYYYPDELKYFFENDDNMYNDDIIDAKEYLDGMYPEEAVEELENRYKNIYYEFADYIYEKIENHNLQAYDDMDYPSWSFFGSPQFITNQWLIHFTSDADSIAQDGFIYGVNDIDKLGLTVFLNDDDKQEGGYNFAFTIYDYERYGGNRYGRGWKYGKEAVVFQAAGIKAYHYGDEEPQVIFSGETARNIIPIVVDDGNYSIVNKKTGRIIYESDRIENIVNWATKNYKQYRNVILNHKSL